MERLIMASHTMGFVSASVNPATQRPNAMKTFRLIAFLLLSELLSGAAFSNPSIQTRIISGGEVSIMDVNARYDGHTIAVSGTGFEIFPRLSLHPRQ